MDISNIQKDIESHVYKINHIKVALINLSTVRYQMIDYGKNNLITEGNFRDYVITLAEQLPKNERKNLVIKMSLDNIKKNLDTSLIQYSLHYKLNTTEEEKQNKMVSFSYYDQNHILGIFSDTSMAILKETIIPKQSDNYKAKMKFLAKNLTFFFCEIDISTHICTTYCKKPWMENYPTYEKQIEWILDNFVKPEQRKQYEKDLTLENVLKNVRNNRFEITCNGSYNFSSYIIKMVFCVDKNDITEKEVLYFYAEDISEIKAQEDKNRQLLEISQQLLDLSQNDGLTGLYNKTAAEREIRNCFSYNTQSPTGALILLDVDNFKYVNDEYGHIVGDKVLKHVATSLTNSFRSMDILCRWGGDEFMVMMKGVTSMKIIESRLERLRMFMKSLEEKNLSLKVTLSIGATMIRENEDFDELFRRADERLYQVKKNGRNSFLIGD